MPTRHRPPEADSGEVGGDCSPSEAETSRQPEVDFMFQKNCYFRMDTN